ncbi:lipase maturation factor family protein [Aliifodinibius sp. S!AR15-10]|uniref:lipase maturation factor family protein n=1 Tax=Aliifodinibius sp. S!AR15-10 TaxID=2950437 RepID=UPI0028642746|nr:lipase maturation factor family protein [Aliifodinibius sp. S!AR15-10]MDR8392666.1 lipase maturation factor family protein [Aliifodinibius sp. S!AR15-10]
MDFLGQLYNGEYWFSRFLLQRALAFIYLLSFVNALNQFPALCGKNGLLPIDLYLERASFKRAPSIFHWRYSDKLLRTVAWIGILLSLVALSGLSEWGPLWISMLIWLLLWALYLSIVNVGQTFYGFGWESMLLEVGFFAIFLGPAHMAAPVLVIWLIRWMLFRVEFGAGLIKMRGDQCWRDLTCLSYHHQTQPLPNPLSRYFHLLPEPIHKMETFFNHTIQLVIVWGLFFPQPAASIAAALIILSQGYLIISGNYSWLNWLTLSLAFSGFSDGVIQNVIGVTPPVVASLPALYYPVLLILGIAVLIMSYQPVKNMLSPGQMMNFSFNPLHLVNTYGAFGSVTKKRYEIILEGTDENQLTDETEWKEYEFKGKPGDPAKRPPQISPYHLRLDWQMWFAAMSSPRQNRWLLTLIHKLLNGNRSAEKLLKKVPFKNEPPKYIRARLFRYRFTSQKEYKETDNWWKRSFVNRYIRPLSLEDF